MKFSLDSILFWLLINTAVTYYGDSLNDLGLSEFVEYGEDGEVEGLFYERMVSVCINAIKELSAKVKDLEKKLGE